VLAQKTIPEKIEVAVVGATNLAHRARRYVETSLRAITHAEALAAVQEVRAAHVLERQQERDARSVALRGYHEAALKHSQALLDERRTTRHEAFERHRAAIQQATARVAEGLAGNTQELLRAIDAEFRAAQEHAAAAATQRAANLRATHDLLCKDDVKLDAAKMREMQGRYEAYRAAGRHVLEADIETATRAVAALDAPLAEHTDPAASLREAHAQVTAHIRRLVDITPQAAPPQKENPPTTVARSAAEARYLQAAAMLKNLCADLDARREVAATQCETLARLANESVASSSASRSDMRLALSRGPHTDGGTGKHERPAFGAGSYRRRRQLCGSCHVC